MLRRLAAAVAVSLTVLLALYALRSERDGNVSTPQNAAPVDSADSELDPPRELARDTAPSLDPVDDHSREAVPTEAVEEEKEEEAPSRVTISARFFDELDRPIAGVAFFASSIPDSPVALSDATGLAELALDWQSLRGFFPQPCSFAARKFGYASLRHREWLGSPEDRFLGEFPVVAGGDVRGRVVDEAGVGIAGAALRPTPATPVDSPERERMRIWGGGGGEFAQTAPDGSFVLEGLPVTTLSVDASDHGTFHTISAPVTIVAGEEVEIPDLVLERAPDGFLIAGVVQGEDDTPVERASLRLHDRERGIIFTHTSTDVRGAFSFTVEPIQRYTLQVLDLSANGWPDEYVEGIEPGTTDLVIVFRTARKMRVVVADEAGNPIRRFSATASNAKGRGTGGHAKSEHGRPVDLSVPWEPFYVTVVAPGFEHALRGPFGDEDTPPELTIELRPTTGIKGRVTADGQPVSGVRVEAHATLDDGRTGFAASEFDVFVIPRPFLLDVTGANGEYFLNTIRPFGTQRCVVHAEAPGLARAESAAFVLDPERNSVVNLELDRGGAVDGRVLVDASLKARGRTVALSRGDGHFETAVTDKAGGYRFEDLAPGEWQIAEVEPRVIERAKSAGTLPPARQGTEITWDLTVSAGDTTHFDLDLSSKTSCRFEGRLLVDGAAPVGWTWTVSSIRGLFKEAFDPNGAFSFAAEEAGKRDLAVNGPRAPGTNWGLIASLELIPGVLEWSAAIETGSLELTGVDAPVIADINLDGQVDVAHTLRVEPSDGLSWTAYVFATDDGTVRFSDVPSGTIRLYDGASMKTTSGELDAPRLEFELAPGEAKTIALD